MAEENLNIIISIIITLLSSIIGFWFLHDSKIKRVLKRCEEILSQKNEQIYELQVAKATLKERLDQTLLRMEFIEKSKDDLKLEFENLANKIFEEKNQKFTYQSMHNINSIINPFKEQIKDFYKSIQESYSKDSKERFSLSHEIARLKELNTRLSQDATNLTNALKGENKTQGIWGEFVLQKVLEDSGLKEGREYVTQKTLSKEGEKKLFRPDVIVHLPEKKDIIIDSKVSLKAYEKYFNSDEKLDRQNALKDHVNSIYLHIKELSSKSYEKLHGIKTLDYVLMFIPIEGAFLQAIDSDKNLFQKAYDQNIILVSPSTLLATLRTIENIWRNQYQNQNAQLIAKKAGNLHDKFVSFVDDLQKAKESLDKASQSYDSAYKKLSTGKGNLINRVNELKELEGISSKKELNTP